MYTIMNGSPKDLERLLQLRENCAFYCEILDHYAPAIVQLKTWNNDDNMAAHCGTTDMKAFEQHVLSISDEAFILLVLINSAERWMADVMRTSKMVSITTTSEQGATLSLPLYSTVCRLCSVKGTKPMD
jgi:hypothetical protein